MANFPIILPVAGETAEFAKNIILMSKNRICCTCPDTLYMPNCTDYLGLKLGHLKLLSQQNDTGTASFPKIGPNLSKISGIKKAVQLKHAHSAPWTPSDPGFGIKCPIIYIDSSQPKSGRISVVGVSKD